MDEINSTVKRASIESPMAAASCIVQSGVGAPSAYTGRERIGMLVWYLVWCTVVYPMPRLLIPSWHIWFLRLFGAKIGPNCFVHPMAKVELPWMLTMKERSLISAGVQVYCLGPIEIGSFTAISSRAVLCAGTHDYEDTRLPLVRSSICIGTGCWICMEAFVGPGAVVGDGSVVGARSVVTGNLPPHMVCAGNPCKAIKPRIFRRGMTD